MDLSLSNKDNHSYIDWQCSCGKKSEVPAHLPVRCKCGEVTPPHKPKPVRLNRNPSCFHRGEITGKVDCGCPGDINIYKCLLLNKSCTEINYDPHLYCRKCKHKEVKKVEPLKAVQAGPIWAITSLSSHPQHQERQPICLNTWVRQGLPIKAVAHNIDKSLYPQVTEWVDCKQNKPRIYDLLHLAHGPSMLINSDIEFYGYDLMSIIKSNKIGIGIRWNYKNDKSRATREEYGLDAFIYHPDQIDTVPDLNMLIGDPMWDYWLPLHFRQHKIEMVFLGEREFYHEKHEVLWTQEQWQANADKVEKAYRLEFHQLKSIEFRKSLPYPPGDLPTSNPS